MNQRKISTRAFALGTTGALTAGLISMGAPAQAAVNVDQPPTTTVSGELDGPIGIEDDAAGNIYIASQNNDSVVVHAKNASGPTTPLRRIAGGATLLNSPRDVALDGNGFLYVAQLTGEVRVFAPGADGNVAPVKSFGTGAGAAWGIDIVGNEIYVRKTDAYQVYAPSATGSPAPTERAVTGLGQGRAITVSGGKVWTPNGTQLRAYSTLANGAATPVQTIVNAHPNSEVNGIDADSQGRVHVASIGGTVRVFSPSADGADQPLKVLGGPASGLVLPTGLTVLSGGAFAVASYSQANYKVFTSLFPKPVVTAPNRPGKIRALRVTGQAKAKKRVVRWIAPKSNGGAAVTSYRIIVKKGNKTLVVRHVSKNRRSLQVKRGQLRQGVNKAYVQAKNKKGYGPAVRKNFRVRK